MNTTTLPPRTETPPRPTRNVGSLVRTGALAGVSAAIAAVLYALAVKAIDVPLEVDGDEIPVPGFAFATLIFSALGVLMALALSRWAKHPARTFAVTTVVLTLGSFGPVVSADADTATQVALVLSHVVVAAIVIPMLAVALLRTES